MTHDLSRSERKELSVFRELLRTVPGIENRLMESSEEEAVAIADLVRFIITGMWCAQR